jgi:hypothetical protein
VPLERIHRLIDECDAVREEQYPLRPITSHQQLAEGDDGAGLARACCHDDESLALVVLLERFVDAADGAFLVIAFDNLLVDGGISERFAGRPPLDE